MKTLAPRLSASRRFLLKAAVLVFSVVALAWLAKPASAGGWAVVTLHHWPGNPVVERPVRLSFSIRAHGQVLMGAGSASIRAFNPDSGERLELYAQPGKRDGDYMVDATFPSTGIWNWNVLFDGAPVWVHPMPPLTVVEGSQRAAPTPQPINFRLMAGAAGALSLLFGAAVYWEGRGRLSAFIAAGGLVLVVLAVFAIAGPTPSEVLPEAQPIGLTREAYGRTLFQAKGCVVCHVHAEGRIGYDGVYSNIGPDLTATKLPAEYIRTWLADPAAIKPKTQMPNLELSAGEIDALAAFLTQGD